MNLSTDAVIDILKSAVEFLNEKVKRGDTLTAKQINFIGRSATLLKDTFLESFETYLYELANQCLPEEDPSISEVKRLSSLEREVIALVLAFLIILFIHIFVKIFPENNNQKKRKH